ncbi:MAG TPA: dihydrolipoamide acetyltransferase family protein, partial [Acidimicrobiales bacterium]|nr:dihydrolipoamide acetyltransferase family protein [Acidimicrobiales bacterium]
MEVLKEPSVEPPGPPFTAASGTASWHVVVEIRMPQLGETVTEGTVVAWHKQVGDDVAEDEVLFEVSTDKVDSDVPSPATGIVTEIRVPQGATVDVGTVLAVIGVAAEEDVVPVAAAALPSVGPQPTRRRDRHPRVRSPVVRRLLAEHSLAPDRIPGSGRDGRITRNDVLAALAGSGAPLVEQGAGDELVPLSQIRRRTAERLRRSLDTAVHTLVVVDVDYSAVDRARGPASTRLSHLPFIARAVVDAIADFPHVNATLTGDGLLVRRSVHLGIAVDLDFSGLVVPVVRDAQRRRLPELAGDIAGMAEQARRRRLGPDDLAGGTFTLTNAGRYGTLLTAPVINGDQVAIVSTDGVRPRPVAVADPDGGYVVAVHPV